VKIVRHFIAGGFRGFRLPRNPRAVWKFVYRGMQPSSSYPALTGAPRIASLQGRRP